MRKIFLFARIATVIFNAYLFFGLGLDFTSCLISTLIVFGITTTSKTLKNA